MKKPTVSTLLWGAMMLFFAVAAVAGDSEPPCLELVIGKCRQCHYLTRICQNLDKKSQGQWKRTIRNMAKRDPDITREQEDRILACLADKAPDVVGFCENPPPVESMAPLKYPNGVKTDP